MQRNRVLTIEPSQPIRLFPLYHNVLETKNPYSPVDNKNACARQASNKKQKLDAKTIRRRTDAAKESRSDAPES